MATVRRRFWGAEGRRRIGYMVTFTDPGGKRKTHTFREEENANYFLEKIAVLEDRWKVDRKIKMLEDRYGLGR